MARLRRLIGIAAFCMAVLFSFLTVAQGDEAAVRAEIVKWAGSDDTDAFLRQPTVRAELQKLLGSEMGHLMHNLDVRGSVELIGWTLSVSGNAPHQGTEEEAVVCVVPGNSMVEAAILSTGTVTVYTRAEQYEYTNRCIKDWITLANSGHTDRMQQPKNVRVVKPAR